MYIGTECYEKQAFLIQTELLCQLEEYARKDCQSPSEVLNEILEREFNKLNAAEDDNKSSH